MAQGIQCPRCFATATVELSENGSNHRALCPKCGLEFEVAENVLRRERQRGGAPATYETQVEEVRRRYVRRVIIFAAIIPAACIMLGLVILAVDRLGSARKQWQADQARARVSTIEKQAKALTEEGRLQEARQKYGDLVDVVTALQSSDADIQQAGAAARAQLELLKTEIEQIAAKQAADAAAAQAAASPPPAPTTTIAAAPAAQVVPASQPARPAIRPMPTDPAKVTDADIERAITRGVNYLIEQYDLTRYELRDPINTRQSQPAEYCGMNALCVYALMQCGMAARDERLRENSEMIRGMLDALRGLNPDGYTCTYARGLRATALSVFNRSQDQKTIREDVSYLLATHNNGAYFYFGTTDEKGRPGPTPDSMWDNSNSQYGLLGVWAAAETGMAIPASYWTAVEQHWVRTQARNGQWDYNSVGEEGSLSMTAAGTASLFVAHDYLSGSRTGIPVGKDVMSPSLRRAMQWWESADAKAINPPDKWWGYTLYGIERVGLASGAKFLGKTDWYRELSRQVVVKQAANGSWGNEIETAYALLFLSRGRHPVLVNKLRFDGSWANRPRDMANLTRYASHKLERQMNWQVVGLRTPWYQWLDAPILYLASHTPVTMEDADYDHIRQYVEAGGLLFTQADADWPQFNAFAKDLAARLFPDYPLVEIPADHPIYKLVMPVNSTVPLMGVSNGVRLLMVHSPKDLARYWHARAESNRQDLFALGTNLLVYAAGKRDFRNRLETPYIEPPNQDPITTVPIARVQYGGNWNPEPGAWRRFGDWLMQKTGVAVNPQPVPAGELSRASTPFAHLTGTGELKLTPAETEGLRSYVSAGGVLLVDAAGGDDKFAVSARKVLGETFTQNKIVALPPSASLFKANPNGMDDLSKPHLRSFALEAGITPASARIEAAGEGSGHVLFSRLDITAGLLGSRTWGIAGYDEDFAPLVLKNAIFWTLDGQKP